MTTLQMHVGNYLKHLQNDRRVTEASLRNYRSTLNSFAVHHSALTAGEVQEFVSCFTNPVSANAARVRLRGFAKFVGVDISKVPAAKEPVPLREALTAIELGKLVAHCGGGENKIALAVEFLGTTGLRYSEFVDMPITQMRDGVRYLQIRGKGRKERVVPLTDRMGQVFNLIYPWKMSEREFRSAIRSAGKRADLTVDVHPHLLRATAASILINEKRADGLFVAQIMGWSKVDTMYKHYLRTDLAALKAVF